MSNITPNIFNKFSSVKLILNWGGNKDRSTSVHLLFAQKVGDKVRIGTSGSFKPDANAEHLFTPEEAVEYIKSAIPFAVDYGFRYWALRGYDDTGYRYRTIASSDDKLYGILHARRTTIRKTARKSTTRRATVRKPAKKTCGCKRG